MEKQVIAENGIKIHYYPLDNLRTFDLAFYIKAGILYEAQEQIGISHLFEHIVFRNINYSLNGKLYETLDENALTFNARTYNELIMFEISGLSSKFQIAAEIMCRLFDDITLPVGEINIEKKRIKAEILDGERPSSAERIFRHNVWEDTPLDREITGKCSTVDKISKNNLNEFKKNIISEENCFFYVAGNVNNKEIEYLRGCADKYKVNQQIDFYS